MKIRNFLKKTLAVVLAFAMLAPIMGNLETNVKEVKAEETVDTEWYIDETENRVYELSTPAQLKGFMTLSKEHNFAGQTIKLMADIALNDAKISELTDYSDLYKWEPIGKSTAFAGTFDGNQKTISGIYCSESTRYAGLFGNIGAATIKDLTIDNSYFESTLASGNANLGAVAGVNGAATFNNVHVTSDVVVKAAGAQWVGGITGMTNGNTTMQDCICEAAITSGGGEVGGLIGYTYAGTTTITRCKSASTITKTGGNGTGGLIGTTYAGTVTISQCMNAGTINTTGGVWIGGLIGRAGGATLTLTDCMNAGEMNCTGNSVIGGIVGRSNTKFTMTRVFNVGSITNTGTMTGAMVGYINAATNPTTCVDCYYAETVVGPVGTASLNTDLNTSEECTVLTANDLAAITGTTAGKMGEFFADGVNAWTHVAGSTPILTWTIPEEKSVDTGWYIDEAEDRVYEISTPAQLKGFMVLSKEHTFAGQTIKLMADIALNDVKISELTDYSDLYKWEPIGKSDGSIKTVFAGTFDGNNKTISGIYCSESTRYAGLFSNIGAATIKDVTIDNSRFESTLASGNANLGAVAGVNGAAIFDNVHVTSDVVVQAVGAQWVGGITGMTNGDTTMEDCVCEATIISGGAEVGGLIGITYAGTTTITRCKSASTITKTGGNGTGGLIGTAYAGTVTMNQCMNAGTINTTGGVWIGGLVGRVGGVTLTLTDCMNAGAMNCTGDSIIGGIVGRSNAKFTMTRVFNVGSITNTKTMTGAMVGYINAATNPTTCVDCYYTETVVGAVGTASLNTDLNTSTECTVLTADDLAAITGTTEGKMGEFFADGVNAWTHVEGSTPVLTWTIPLPEDDSLNIKCQVTQGVVTQTNIEKYRGKYVIRFVSAVKDYTDYDEIGFKVLEDGQTTPKKALVKTVFKRIESTTGSTDTEQETYTFSPKVINTDAEYFITAKLPVAPENKAENYTVWAYGIKKDGTEVIGSTRCVSVEDGLKNCETINMSFENTSDLDLTGATLTVNDTYNAKVIGVNDKTVHVRISGVPTPLKSATLFKFKKGDTIVGKEMLRNLYTEYTGNGTADDSWYTEYLKADSTETEFTIATSAELYGLATLVNTNLYSFSGKKIYLVSDIAVNGETLIAERTDSHNGQWRSYNETSGTYEYTTLPTYSDWTPIGKGTTFHGTFDGQMHTISGIHCADTSQNTGLFARTGANSNIQNLKLVNSYFGSTYIGGTANIGSVAGKVDAGTIINVYSNAIVEGAQSFIGGLVGMANTSITMDQCWYDGQVTSNVTTDKYQGTGGLVGDFYSGTLTMTNCLNTGTVDASLYTATAAPCAGGLVGWMNNGTAKISNSLNAGNIKISDTATTGYGFIVGYKGAGTIDMTDNVYSTTGEWTSDVISKSSYPTLITQMNEDELKGKTLDDLGFDTIWTTVPNHIPVLRSLKTAVIDDSWYNDNADTFVLYDKADLFGFAALSNKESFAKKTVKLGNDIEVNIGDYKQWSAMNAPKHEWTPIGSTVEFNGTFDGQGHTISGVYLNSSSSESGLFAKTNISSTIKNLSLKNSYFESTGANLGSIAGLGKGKFYNIYSDAIVKTSNAGGGGLVGSAESLAAYPTYHVILKNCWFDGSVTNTGKSTGNRGTGGILGVIAANANVEIENCLNEGTIDVKAYEYDQNKGEKTDEEGNLILNVTPIVGGVVGYIKGNATVDISGCLNVGEIKYADIATGGYNPLVGYNTAGTTLTISGCYATKESCEKIDLSNISSDSVTQVDASAIKSTDAQDVMKLLDWNAWECRADDFPAVKLEDTTSAEVDYTATEADSALLTALYDGYTLYQGELHNHANNGGSSDGTVALTDWKTQMDTLDLDFAASLDHRQTWHINHADWDKSLFIYGSEAGTTISDYTGTTGDGELHYNMIFSSQAQLKNVVENFKSGVFEYNSNYDNDSTGKWTETLGVKYYDKPSFKYQDFTRTDFGNLIDYVKADNDQDGKPDGLFVIPHPMQQGSAYFSDDALEYWFRDYVGFEVIYTQLNCGNTRTNYSAWKELLADGKRLWATSGSDSHADLTNTTLTSVYADATDKANGKLIDYMTGGNFTAGSVGIQMCVGDTPMGGHRNFAGQRVVVNVGELHTSVYNSTNKYRVDILNEDGIVYSQALTVDATTKTPTNGTIAFNADANSDFYRVVVYDMTKGYRIAYGNPIWNDK